jgi:hypothetical protein
VCGLTSNKSFGRRIVLVVVVVVASTAKTKALFLLQRFAGWLRELKLKFTQY